MPKKIRVAAAHAAAAAIFWSRGSAMSCGFLLGSGGTSQRSQTALRRSSSSVFYNDEQAAVSCGFFLGSGGGTSKTSRMRTAPSTAPSTSTSIRTARRRSSSSMVFSSSASSSSSRAARKDEAAAVPAACTATVDYSAVNEYVRAHYGRPAAYFDFDDDRTEHRFHDGRALQSLYSGDEGEMLRDNGLAVIQSPLPSDPIDWSRVEDVGRCYLPVLERIIRGVLFPSNELAGCFFWNPMVRGEDYEISRDDDDDGGVDGGGRRTPTANIASMVHIDTDVGAFDVKEFLNIVKKNMVRHSTTTSEAVDAINFEEVAHAIVEGKRRFAVLNFWRNIRDEPATSAPLAILSTRYDRRSKPITQRAGRPVAFPDARPDMDESRWYVFPNATKDEIVVFYQYDRNALQPSDLFHCAISPAHRERSAGGADPSARRPRRSFDVRALIVFDEGVPEEVDRYSPDRTRPALTFEESGCFCDEQAEMRRGDVTQRG